MVVWWLPIGAPSQVSERRRSWLWQHSSKRRRAKAANDHAATQQALKKSSFASHAFMHARALWVPPRILTATSGRTGCTRPSLSDWWHQLLHSVVCRPEDYMYMLMCICNQLLQQVRVRRLYGVHANNENGHCVRVLLDLKDAHC